MKIALLFSLPIFVILTGCTTTTAPQLKTLTPQTQKAPKAKVALVLGGGGAKGFAHIGVINALEKNGISPDIIVGTSAGAIVGSIYASGKSPSELVALADSFEIGDVLDVTPSHQGLIEGKKLRQYVNTHAGADISKFPKKFGAVASDNTEQAVLFDKGETGLVVQASASLPKLFIAPRIPENHGKKYHDAGKTALVPSRFAKTLGADVVIAVDVLYHQAPKSTNSSPTHLTINSHQAGIQASIGSKVIDIPVEFDKLPIDIRPIFNQFPNQIALPSEVNDFINDPNSIWQALEPNYAIMNPSDIAASNVIIRPNLAKLSTLDTSTRDEMIAIGEQATQEHIDEIKRLIDKANESVK